MNAPATAFSSSAEDAKRQKQRQAADIRFKAAIDHLTGLLTKCDAAEELASTWQGAQLADGETKKAMGLRDLKRMLDSGRRVAAGAEGSRGIPMWLVIRAVKASWHRDGSWPILGVNEEAADDALASLPRSVHAETNLLRPPGHTRAQIPPRDPEAERGLPPQRPDPDPEDVVRRYEEQGVDVGPAPKGEGFEDW